MILLMPLCSLAHPEVGEMNPAAEWRYRLCPPMDVSLFCPSHEESKEKTQNNLWDAGDEDTLEIWPVALKAEIHMKAFKKSCVCVCVYPQWLQKGIGSLGDKVQSVVSCLMWVLGTELRSSGRVASVHFSSSSKQRFILSSPSPITSCFAPKIHL
jgi:hypothetical protein